MTPQVRSRQTLARGAIGPPPPGPGGITRAGQDPAAVQRLFTASYPGLAESVTAARHDVAAALSGVPAAEDAEFCLGEIAANAVIHSRSGQPGGHFTIAADILPGELVLVGVADQGGPWTGRKPDTYPHVQSLPVPELAVYPPGWDQTTGSLSRRAWPRGSFLPLGPLPGAAECAGQHARVIAGEWGLGHFAEAAGEAVTAMTASVVAINAELAETPPVLLWLRSGPVGSWPGSGMPPLSHRPRSTCRVTAAGMSTRAGRSAGPYFRRDRSGRYRKRWRERDGVH